MQLQRMLTRHSAKGVIPDTGIVDRIDRLSIYRPQLDGIGKVEMRINSTPQAWGLFCQIDEGIDRC